MDTSAMEPSIGDPRHVELMQRIAELKATHRELDAAIQRLYATPRFDQLELTRLKRRKLLVKDQIARLERELDPDVPA